MTTIDDRPTTKSSTTTPRAKTIDPTLKLVLELGPLACFFLASYRYGLQTATGVLMVGVVVTLVVSYALTRRLPIMPVVTAAAVLVFGALTLYFDNPVFIKVKPTVINCIFGAALLGGLVLQKPLLPIVLDSALHLDEDGWRKLTFRWGLFFFVLAALNEIVWRTQSEVFWAGFKVFGTMPLTLLFALSQVPLIMKHDLKAKTPQDEHF